MGILFIACSVASILSVAPLGSMLDSPDYLAQLAANSDKVVLTALIEFVWAARPRASRSASTRSSEGTTGLWLWDR